MESVEVPGNTSAAWRDTVSTAEVFITLTDITVRKDTNKNTDETREAVA